MLAGWGKNETISRIPFARFHFERVKKRFCIYTFRCVFRLNSSRLVPPFQYRGLMAFDEREGGRREREVVAPRRLCDRIGVGRKFENFQLSRSSVYRSYDVLNFGGTVMPALRVTYRERNLKFIIPRRVFSREFREGQKVRLYYQFVSLSLSVGEAIPRRERGRKIGAETILFLAFRESEAGRTTKETGDGCGP